MPNTLAHFGVQGLVSRGLWPRVDPAWIFLGCVLPDVPAILQRAVWTVLPRVDAYDLRLYVVAQSSLFATLFLCGALALCSVRPRPIFVVLAVNAVLHLVLDALQTKFANGVHLLVPFSWELVNFGLFWPESVVAVVLTLLGVYVFIREWRTRADEPSPARPRGRRLMAAGLLGVVYLALPVTFMGSVEATDNHFVRTLRERNERVGRPVEFDRAMYLERGATDSLRTFAGERLAVRGKESRRTGLVSVRGVFVEPGTVRIDELHEHWRWWRDVASYAGLALLAGLWGRRLVRSLPVVQRR